MKGKTKWFPIHIAPVRNGTYECIVKFSSSVPPMRWMLEWDGHGFLTPIPMVVYHWRGQTRKAAHGIKENT